jgi:TolB-like protein/Flp pilus assembly protein TadD
MGLVSELRRRNVFRMGVLYVVAAWLIMQVAGVLMDLGALPVAIGPWVLVVLVIGFPIALVFSWLFEITPEGLALEKDVPEGASITHITGRRMDFIVIAILSAGLILFAYDKWWIGPPPDRSIAVLAFENMSGDPEQEYFSDGISEELLNVLAKVPGLTVISRSSSFSFKDKNTDTPTIARQLNVAHVLEGSVRKQGNTVRITAQLIDAKRDAHLWSETYDRDLEDVFAVQDEISNAIVAALKIQMGFDYSLVRQATGTTSREAHEAYLRGRHLLVKRTRVSVEDAVREFEKAIAFDPDYAIAYAEAAIATVLLTRANYGDLTRTEAFSRAIPLIERAEALDPNLAEVHAARGLLLAARGGAPKEALAHYKRAIQVNPNYSVVYAWMGTMHDRLGQYEEAFSATKVAARLDPLSKVAIANYALELIFRDRLEEARGELAKLASLAPDWAAIRTGLLESFGGKWANELLGGLEGLRPEATDFKRLELSRLFATIGLVQEALAVYAPPDPETLLLLDRTKDAAAIVEGGLADDPDRAYYRVILGRILAAAGDYDHARPMLEELWKRSGGLVTSSGMFRADDAIALIVSRQFAGESTMVDELIAAIRDNVRRYREAGITRAYWNRSADYEEGLAYYLAGERDKGLSLIEKGAEDGYFIPTDLAYLQMLYDDPEFAPILASQAARQARERQRFLSIVCSANPYASFWQPAEGTCESFAAENEASR